MPAHRRSGRFSIIVVGLLAVVLLALWGSTRLMGRERVSPESLADSIAATLADRVPAREVTAQEWKRVRNLYEGREHRALWVDGGGRFSSGARELVTALRQADRDGLRIADYPMQAVEDAVEGARSEGDASALARADVLLTAAYVDLATDLLTGRFDPRRVSKGWHIDAKAFDVDSAVNAALGDGSSVTSALDALRPADPGYDALVKELARYREIEKRGGWRPLPASPRLVQGRVHPAVAALRQRLRLEGYPIAGEPARPDSFDTALATAVAQFQGRHGLPVDSAVGPATRVALDLSAERRAEQIAANLERMRWLPPQLGSRRIVVNIPAYRLEAFDADRRVLEMRVVVGDEIDGKTPVFADSMRFVEFGPYWNVPSKIAIEEILPKANENPGYLEANDYEVVAGDGDDAPVVRPATLTEEDITASRYRVRQRPGPKNALGHVKFLFPNDFAVYLHDTPARALFNANERAASHGCVRVEDPAALARFVLEGHPEWTAARIDEALAAGERQRVTIKRAIPVYLLYLTAFVSDGTLMFREDIYDSDAQLLRLVDEDDRPVVVRDSVAREAATRLARELGAT